MILSTYILSRFFFSIFVLFTYEFVIKISSKRSSMKLRIQFTTQIISLNCTCALNFRKTASNKAAAKQSLKRWQDIYFTVVNCLFYRSTWFPQSFINQILLTVGLPHQLWARKWIIWWLIFQKKSFQFWREIWIWGVVVLLQL